VAYTITKTSAMTNTNKKIGASDVIISRQLDIHDESGKIISHVTILIGKPEHSSEDQAWSCSYSVDGLNDIDPSTYRILGIDSVQAVQSAFVAIEGLLEGSDIHKKGLLRWNGDNKSKFMGRY
jgi:hypothetical protein